MMKFKFLLIPLLSLLAFSSHAQSGPVFTGQSTQVRTVVPSKCTIVSLPGIAFGTYRSLSTNMTAHLDAQSTMTVRCTMGTDAKFMLGAGQGTSARCTGVPLRRFGATLSYDLYQDSARTRPWGCDDDNTARRQFPFSSTADYSIVIYGRIPAGQNPTRGSFTDTVVMSVVL